MLSKEQRDSLRRFPVCGLRAEDVRKLLDTCDELERERDLAFQNNELDDKEIEHLHAQIDSLKAELSKASGAADHMAACRTLLKVPDNEVLYEAIKELMEEFQDMSGHMSLIIQQRDELKAQRRSHE